MNSFTFFRCEGSLLKALTPSVHRIKNNLKTFHADEAGTEVPQALMMIFIAAVILGTFMKFAQPEVFDKVAIAIKGTMNTVVNFSR